jgi:hypothetical protein
MPRNLLALMRSTGVKPLVPQCNHASTFLSGL